MILALVDEGKLRLDDKAARYLPNFTGQKAGMTIRQMFSHTSGLSHEPWYDRERNMTLAEAADKIAAMPMVGDPGTKLHYGNQSMQAAGRIAEIISGKPWAELFKEKIAGPLKMQHTDYNAFWETKNPMIGGSARSNVDDLGNFLLMVMSKGRFQGKQVLSEKAIDEMFRNQSGDVAIGWHPWATYREADPRIATIPYGVGWWLEEWDKKTSKAWAASSGGAFGCNPFVDFKRNLAGVFLPYNRRIGRDGQILRYNEAHVVYLELRNLIREIIPEKAQGLKSPRSASLTPDPGKGEWQAYGGDNRASKYAPLDQINRQNVNQLRIAWRWTSPDGEILKQHADLKPGEFQATPLMVGGVLYTSTAMSQVAAIDATTGKTIWAYDPETWRVKRPTTKGFFHRGVAYWGGGRESRIFIATGDSRLIALEAKTGKKILSFGEDGEINLRKAGLSRPVEGPPELYGHTSPPIICRDVVIVGSYISDPIIQRPMPPGDVRGFDVRTGKLLWTFHTIPRPGEFGHETWENDSWKHNGNANVWAPMSADDQLGYVYLPVSTPTGNFTGKDRPGDGLFGESLVCIEAKTGKRVWSFQLVHHGIWDYDLPAAPNLVDITVDGRRIKAVAQVTKQGFCYVFDRVTGRPVWPIEERPVPPSKVPGEKTSPTQPFPTRPPAFERQGVTIDDLIDFTPELRAEAIEILKQFEYGPLFTPPAEKPTILLPGAVGGANWNGAAVDPETGWLYVPSVTAPLVYPPHVPAENEEIVALVRRVIGPKGLPLFKPPYGRITAIDLNRGEIVWQVANGDGPRNHPAIKHLNPGPLGSAGRVGPLLTRTLLFAGEGPQGLTTAAPIFRAYDKATGKVIWEFKLDQHVVGAPMTYLAGGKQYIVVSCGFRRALHELIAFSLP